MKVFRLVSLLEGISYLLILSITLGIISREYVSLLGAAHGMLFIAYLLCSTFTSHKRNWPVTRWLLVCIASLIPFAFIAVEAYLRKELNTLDLSHYR